jgi:acetyl-CoA synthetase
VVPHPDPVRHTVPKAYVTLAADHVAGREAAQALFKFCRTRLAPYKPIRRIEFVDELPKTISGKIRRVQLRHQEVERQAAALRGDQEFLEEDFKLDDRQ